MCPSPTRAIKVLFVCHYNRKRSATAERIFGKDPALDVKSAGTSVEAMVQVNGRMLDWADIVFTMSAINGDKSRHSINRKRGIARRVKVKALLAAKKNPSGATDAPASDKSPRSSAKAR